MPFHFASPESLVAKARELGRLPIAVAAAGSAFALEGARRAYEQGIADPVLVGDPATIERIAREIRWPIEGIRIVAADDDEDAAQRAVALARSGECGAMMKGHLHTDVLMLAALDKKAGLRTGRRFSHAFHMTVPNWQRSLFLSDCAVNISPNVDTKLDIVRNLVDLIHALGNDAPKIALLSATEEVTERIQSSMDAAEVTRRCAEGAVTGATVFGPLAFDVAMSEEAARIKGIDNPVAGHADALVVADIDSGNALFKMMVHFMGATAAGVVLGALVPIVLTSRSDPPQARLTSTAIARLLAAEHQPLRPRATPIHTQTEGHHA
ncbi:MAG TPA: bifunctional enoyl-CoA hydratase/phosphate acetyltransferase [Candidatus Omnitrophota bacterium]|nr:bifunctional enoyl-CoA hydratase/phosphate acetyltransferase [Candidatus Omnitrophota bacterium]